MGRRTVLLLATTALATLLASGVALALNTVNCEPRAERCVGTDRPDLMRGTSSFDLMFGRDRGDTMKGFGRFDALLGQKGDDRLFGGLRQDFLIGGQDDDKLRGEEGLDIHYFERSNWGQDTIIEDLPPRNVLLLPDRPNFNGTITTNMISGPLPEVSNVESGSTVNWDDDVIGIVVGSTGNDTVTGTDRPDRVFDDMGPDFGTDADTDTISGGVGGDLLVVADGDGDDTVECGAGNDTVFFDEGAEGDTLVVPDDCEEQNPEGQPGLEVQQGASYRDQVLEAVPESALEDSAP